MPPVRRAGRGRAVIARLFVVEQSEAGRAAARHADEIALRAAPRSQSSTSPISGTSPSRGASRSLRPSRQSPSGPRSTPSQAANTSPVDKRDARIDQQHRRPGNAGSSTSSKLVPGPFAPRGHAEQAGGHVGAESSAQPRSHAPGRSPTAGSAAAAPPPHRPSRRQCPKRPAASCRGSSCAPASTPATCSQGLGGEQHQIVLARQIFAQRARPLPGRSSSAGSAVQPIAVLAEGEQRLDRMPPVGQPPAHMQRKVELGRSRLRKPHQGAAVAGVSPASSLARAASWPCPRR